MAYEYVDTNPSDDGNNGSEYKESDFEKSCRTTTLIYGILTLLFFLVHSVSFFMLLLYIFPVYIIQDPWTFIDRERWLWWPQIFLPLISIQIAVLHLLQLPLELLIGVLSLTYFITSSPAQKPKHPLANALVGLSNSAALVAVNILHFFLFLVNMALPLSLWQVTYWEIGTAALFIFIPPSVIAMSLFCTHMAGNGVINIIDFQIGPFFADLAKEKTGELRRKRKMKKNMEEKREEMESFEKEGFHEIFDDSSSSGSSSSSDESFSSSDEDEPQQTVQDISGSFEDELDDDELIGLTTSDDGN